jgi:membrane-associated phospholipid phosphatase
MTKALFVLLWPVGLVAIIGAGAILARRAPAESQDTGPLPVARTRGMAGSADFSPRDLARFLVAILVGSALIYAIMVLIGLIVVHGGPTIDKPIWHWTVHHRVHVWKSFMGEVTQLGYKWTTWGAAVTAAVILAIVSPKHRWLPPVALVLLILVEHFLTRGINVTFHRPGPPGSGGTFPSGGTDRAVAMYGLMVYFLWRELSGTKRGAIWAGTIVAAFGFSEAYSRGYLAVHWFTDIVSGFIYGFLLFAAFAAAVRLIAGPAAVSRGIPGTHRVTLRPSPAEHAGDTTR